MTTIHIFEIDIRNYVRSKHVGLLSELTEEEDVVEYFVIKLGMLNYVYGPNSGEYISALNEFFSKLNTPLMGNERFVQSTHMAFLSDVVCQEVAKKVGKPGHSVRLSTRHDCFVISTNHPGDAHEHST